MNQNSYLKTSVNPLVSTVVLGLAIVVFLVIVYFAHQAYLTLDAVSTSDVRLEKSIGV